MSTAMMAITTRSSINVKALSRHQGGFKRNVGMAGSPPGDRGM
jgi:hypothetical protein